MNPVITKMEDFTIIVNGFSPFAIATKSSILNSVGFLDPSLHCNKFTANQTLKDGYIYLHTLGESI